jgi:hypothetical protein
MSSLLYDVTSAGLGFLSSVFEGKINEMREWIEFRNFPFLLIAVLHIIDDGFRATEIKDIVSAWN